MNHLLTVPLPQQPPGHLRDAIRELRDYASDVVASRRVRDVWELARHLFTDTVCRALKISKPRPYDPRDDGIVVRVCSPHRSKRDSSPRAERRSAAHPEPELHRGGPSRHASRRDLLLDESDRKELEELERQTAEDNQLVKHFEERAVERAEREKKILLAAQINKEAALLQEKKQLWFGHTERQVNLVKVASLVVPKPRALCFIFTFYSIFTLFLRVY